VTVAAATTRITKPSSVQFTLDWTRRCRRSQSQGVRSAKAASRHASLVGPEANDGVLDQGGLPRLAPVLERGEGAPAQAPYAERNHRVKHHEHGEGDSDGGRRGKNPGLGTRHDQVSGSGPVLGAPSCGASAKASADISNP
jgi:hypothetical protein